MIEPQNGQSPQRPLALEGQEDMVVLEFYAGTLAVRGLPPDIPRPPCLSWDERTACYRSGALHYAEVVLHLRARGVEYRDDARGYLALDRAPRWTHAPRPYQEEALAAFRQNRRRGVVVLPTGAGKTHLAMLCIADANRSTLVVAPTLDLVRQWVSVLAESFGGPIGIVGGGEYSTETLTVTTYDSAHRIMSHLGSRFGLLVFDECHHLPGPTYSFAAMGSIAPFRLGLTATPDRTDGRTDELDSLIGPIAYRKDIVELRGEYLADYDTRHIEIDLEPDERERYESHRATYLAFLRKHGIRMPDGWGRFILLSSRSEEGRLAMLAYRSQRSLSLRTGGKIAYLEQLLEAHRHDRMLIFTEDNDTAYEIARRCLVPVITHQTKVRERAAILAGLSSGEYGAIVTSKVLNEGVDVPSANVAVILSGSGSVREHVQRLGRVLRKSGDKRAILYELVSRDTSEKGTSERRREHSAYRAP